MLFPFVGVFLAVSLWGAFFPVPGFMHPEEGFLKRIGGAFCVTLSAKMAFHLAEDLHSEYMVPHEDLYDPWTDFESPWDWVELDTTETALSVVIPLWEEAVEQPVCDWHSTASRSPTPSGVTFTVIALGFLASVWFLWKGLGSSGAYTLRMVRDWFGRLLGGKPKVAHYLETDGASSLYKEMDALIAGPMPSAVSASFIDAVLTTPAMLTPPEEQQVERVVMIHQEVEAATPCLERRCSVSVVPDVDPCTVKKDSDSIPNGANDAFSKSDGLAPDTESATGSTHPPERQRDLVPRQPAPVEAGAEPESTPRQRNNRPNQRQRRAYQRRLEREQQEQLEREVEQTDLAAGPGPLEPQAPITRNLGPVNPGDRGVLFPRRRNEQQGGPPPAPTPVMGVHPPPSGDIQPMPQMPPCPPHGPC
ncbi:hypothetical protein P168DRAFT_279961 [Aspergillus campestris IBT 28561]|uniref:Uncharacterized protein n=1 Tax=Aspergillus campestris (strain IBT 28561) TaxID=1392248 RepID=A0A2I1D9J1_ASPC2|nr:uncharacterized protein P168DRAFT_279961 [Aspergillus campestris IBT 28561]PKY06544.1 hypothetical protein P168DRAFT_279961 [Aspergillus campestris IBT 28561]